MALVGKDQLVHEVAERSGLEVEAAGRFLEETLRAIETELGNGNEVRLTGFGKFSVSRRKAREGRNPQTGEPMRIAAKKVPHFSAGAELRNAVPEAPREGASKSRSEETKTKTSAASGTKQPADLPDEVQQGNARPEVAGPEASQEDQGANQSEGKRAKGTAKGPRKPRRPATRDARAVPADEAALDSRGAEEGESAETGAEGEAVSAAASKAKFAIVGVAGLAVGVASGLAIVHRR